MMTFVAHKELYESASWSTCFPPYDSWAVSLKGKKVQSCSRVFGDRVSNVQALFLPICASLCYELGAALVGVWFGAHGFEYLVRHSHLQRNIQRVLISSASSAYCEFGAGQQLRLEGVWFESIRETSYLALPRVQRFCKGKKSNISIPRQGNIIPAQPITCVYLLCMFPYHTGLNALEIPIWMFPHLIQLRKKRQFLPERPPGCLKRGTVRTCC